MESVSMGRRLAAFAAVCAAFAAVPALADVSITPRVGYFFDNNAQRQSGRDLNTAELDAYGRQQSAQLASTGIAQVVVDPIRTSSNTRQASFPQLGATLTFDWGDEGTQVALTALYGSASVNNESAFIEQRYNYNILGTRIVDVYSAEVLYSTKYTRVDLEATLQHRLNETFSFVAGLRGERTRGNRLAAVSSTASTNGVNYAATKYNELAIPLGLQPVLPVYFIPAPATTLQQDLEIWRYSIRAGAAAYAPIGEKQLFYVNGLLQLTRQPRVKFRSANLGTGAKESSEDYSENGIGPDISVGYMYRFSDRFGIDARYRVQVYFPVSGPNDFTDSRLNHGVMLGFTTWFGG
jgi:long-subunit fatty acid transport protein